MITVLIVLNILNKYSDIFYRRKKEEESVE